MLSWRLNVYRAVSFVVLGAFLVVSVLDAVLPVTGIEWDAPSGTPNVRCGPAILALFHLTDGSRRHPAVCDGSVHDRLVYELFAFVLGFLFWFAFFVGARRRIIERYGRR